jgi:hypothetical protein
MCRHVQFGKIPVLHIVIGGLCHVLLLMCQGRVIN